MKKTTLTVIALLFALAAAVGAYLWGMALMDTLYSYRSPLHNNPPAPGSAPLEPLSRRVVFVLVDGLRVDTAADPAVMPFLAELRRQGASATMHSRTPSYSAPGYAVLLTGAWPELSDGPAANLDYADILAFTQDDLFAAAHRRGLKTALSGYNWFEKLVPAEAITAGFFTAGYDRAADEQVVQAALPWLQNGQYQWVLIHLDQVDYAGHYESGGAVGADWKAAANRSDNLIRQIAAALDLEQDTLLVASDHGHIDAGGHGGQETVALREPFLLAGKGVRPGQYPDIQMVDLAPTIAVLLGINLPASTQGQPRLEMLDLEPDQQQAVAAAVQAQQRGLLAAYEMALGMPDSSGTLVSSVPEAQTRLEDQRDSRIRRERLPRALGVLAGFVLLAAGLALASRGGWFRTGSLVWVLGGVAVYTLVFNLVYRVAAGRSYSFSSVKSANDLIFTTALFATIALLGGWLVLAWQKRASSLGLGLVYGILLSLALPVAAHVVLNGPVITWHLPDLGVYFVALLALVQAMFVAVVGSLLFGLSVLAAKLRRPRFSASSRPLTS